MLEYFAREVEASGQSSSVESSSGAERDERGAGGVDDGAASGCIPS
jgi:hypothetical protein